MHIVRQGIADEVHAAVLPGGLPDLADGSLEPPAVAGTLARVRQFPRTSDTWPKKCAINYRVTNGRRHFCQSGNAGSPTRLVIRFIYPDNQTEHSILSSRHKRTECVDCNNSLMQRFADRTVVFGCGAFHNNLALYA